MSSSEPPSLKVTRQKTTSVDSYHTRDATKHWQADSFERSRPLASKTSKVQAHHGKPWELRCSWYSNRHALQNSQRAQGAFKDSMIHWILQFTLLIAFRCVLHRCESQEIRCWKLYCIALNATTFHETLLRCVCKDIEPQQEDGGALKPQNYRACTGVSGCANRACTCPHSRTSNNSCRQFGNDPSAGSPTETLLRLLLPLNDQVWSTSQQQWAISKLLMNYHLS